MTSLACGGWFPPHFPPPILHTPIMCPRRGTVRDTHTLTPFSSLISGFGRSVLLPGCRLNRNAISPKLRNSDQHVWSCDCEIPLQHEAPSPVYMRQVRYVIMHETSELQLLYSTGVGSKYDNDHQKNNHKSCH